MLEYKARKHGRYFGRTGRWEPTSQVCSACGARDGPKPLSVRIWTCAACGITHDRDVNAARNILALGRRERLNACGGKVRPGLVPAPASETGTFSPSGQRGRQDPKLIRTNNKQLCAARSEALLNGAPVPATSTVMHHVIDHELRWIVPATCLECGARVDQSTASFAEHSVCTYCGKPLPCEPASAEDY